MKDNTPQKTCNKCNCAKPLTEFYKQFGMVDGRLNQCKSCIKTSKSLFKKNGSIRVAKQTKAPAVSVFSINPETNLPYISFEHAEKLAYTHVMRYAKNLHQHKYMDVEDLKQEVMVKIVKSKYDPTKSAPQTFIINCANSHLGNLAIHMDRKRRTVGEGDNLQEAEISDFLRFKDNEDGGMMTDSAVDNITPEDYILAREAVEEFIVQQEVKPAYKRVTVPTGYTPSRDLKVTPKKTV